jgi:hypothetical protein
VNFKLEFQYKPAGYQRPLDYVQDDEFVAEHDELVPIPAVGDSVSYLEDGKVVARKVKTRHFSYQAGWCIVNIVVTDMPDEEMAARLKE